MNRLTPLISGVVFGLGLALSGMTEPARIVGFLDVLGDWDPTLVFVMGGALLAHAVTAKLVRRRKAPLYASAFEQPRPGRPDVSLVGGSAMFGVGWALSGFCPGPAFVALASLHPQPIVFVVSMLAGMAFYTAMRQPSTAPQTAEEPCG